jgi:hypothetical protein
VPLTQGECEALAEMIVWGDAMRDGLGLTQKDIPADFYDHKVLPSFEACPIR